MLIEGAELETPAAPLDDLLRVGLDAAPDEVAITSSQRALTWREIDRVGLKRIAEDHLHPHGLGQG